jgi:hypothetical protein
MMWKVLFLLVVLLTPSVALADCSSRLALVQSLFTPVAGEASGAVQFANDKCPGGITIGCWPLEAPGDALVVSRIATLSGWVSDIDTDCVGETDAGVLAWKATVDGEVSIAIAQFEYLHGIHLSFAP